MSSPPLYSADQITDWHAASGPVPYPAALAVMEARVAEIAAGQSPEHIWLLEHPPLYTAGTSAKPEDLVMPDRFDVFKSGRGGQYTYHGPGQRVAYVMLNLSERSKDIRCFVSQLESWIIDTLDDFSVTAGRREGRVGVWVDMPGGGESKIAAIGVRVRKWVTFHGISINLNPDLSHFAGIVPCGISNHGVTSLHAMGVKVDMAQLDARLKANFTARFGPIQM